MSRRHAYLLHAFKAGVGIPISATSFGDCVALGGSTGMVQLWRIPPPARSIRVAPSTIVPFAKMRAHTGSVTSLTFLDSGFLLSGGSDGRVCLWRVSRQSVYAEATSSPSPCVARGARPAVMPWHGAAFTPKRLSIFSHDAAISCISPHPRKPYIFFTSVIGHGVYRWNIAKRTVQAVREYQQAGVVEATPAGLLLTEQHARITELDLSSFERARSLDVCDRAQQIECISARTERNLMFAVVSDGNVFAIDTHSLRVVAQHGGIAPTGARGRNSLVSSVVAKRLGDETLSLVVAEKSGKIKIYKQRVYSVDACVGRSRCARLVRRTSRRIRREHSVYKIRAHDDSIAAFLTLQFPVRDAPMDVFAEFLTLSVDVHGNVKVFLFSPAPETLPT